MYFIQHCLICRPSDSTVSDDAGIEPRTVGIGCQTLWPLGYISSTTRLHLIHPQLGYISFTTRLHLIIVPVLVPSLALLAAAKRFEGESASANVDRMLVVAVAEIVRRPGSVVLDRKPQLISFHFATNTRKVNGQPLTTISIKDKKSELCLQRL
jgi:hypothetical protein